MRASSIRVLWEWRSPCAVSPGADRQPAQLRSLCGVLGAGDGVTGPSGAFQRDGVLRSGALPEDLALGGWLPDPLAETVAAVVGRGSACSSAGAAAEQVHADGVAVLGDVFGVVEELHAAADAGGGRFVGEGAELVVQQVDAGAVVFGGSAPDCAARSRSER